MEVIIGGIESLEQFQKADPCSRPTGPDHQLDHTMQSESDDEQQAIIVRKRNRSIKLVLRDDSDEDASPDGPPVNQDSGNRHDFDSDTATVPEPKATTKRKRRIVAMSSTDSETEAEEKKPEIRAQIRPPKKGKKSVTEPTATASKKRQNKGKENGGSQLFSELESDHPVCEQEKIVMINGGSPGHKHREDSDDEQSLEKVNCLKSKTFLSNNDLFDAEDSDGPFSFGDAGHDEESGYSLEEIKKTVKQKMKQKVAKPDKPKKLSKDGLKQLHSESQRIVRESRVSLPYHTPKPKSLDEFLNRRKSTPTCLRPNSREIASILNAELQLKKIDSNAAKETIPSQPNVNFPPDKIVVTTAATLLDIGVHVPDLLSSSDQAGPCSTATVDGIIALPDQSAKVVLMFENSSEKQTQDWETLDDLPDLGSLPSEKNESDFVDDRPTLATNCDAANNALQSMGDELIVGGDPEMNVSKTARVTTECHTPLQDDRRRLTSKLRISLTPLADETPKLGGKPHSVISLVEEPKEWSPDGTPIRQGGVNGLIHRFMHHSSSKRKHKSKQTVELNVLKFQQTSSGEEQLLNEKVKVTLSRSADEIPEGLPPGERLRLFKESLKLKLQRQRLEARQQRALLKAEDEELAGGSDQDEPEEEILSDPTDSEEEESDEEVDDGILFTKEKKHKRNAFIDDEAEESDDNDGMDADDEDVDEEEEVNGQKSEKPATTGSAINIAEPSTSDTETQQSIRLWLQLDDEGKTETQISPPENNRLAGPDKVNLSRADTVELLESQGSILPGNQLQTDLGRPKGLDDSELGDSGPFTQLSCIVGGPLEAGDEDSIDSRRFKFPQFRESAESQSTGAKSSFQLQLELCKSQTQSQTNSDEVFELCSGKWSDDQVTQTPGGTSVLGDLAGSLNTQDNMNQLLDLCSGTFSGVGDVPATSPKLSTSSLSNAISDSPRKAEKKILKTTSSGFKTGPARYILSDEENSNSSLSVVPRRYSMKSNRVISDSEGDDATNDELSDEEEDYLDEEFPKKRTNVRDFFEGEAELSGSDVPSDEDEELAEEDDILEEELGDQDVLMSEDELKEQVGKVHHKLLMDEDQKQLRLYKELYLEDGDLHSDTNGRTRKFRWNTNDDDSQDNHPRLNSDSEMDENEACEEEHVEMRLKRHEREKWLNEPKKTQNSDDEDENLHLGHKVQVLSRNNSQILMESSRTQDKKFSTNPKPVALRGSFLSRGKVVLAKIADMTKSTSDAGKKSGPRNSRNFVFSVVSPSKEPRPSSPVPSASSVPKSAVRVAKKPKLEKRLSLPGYNSSNVKSIFDMM